MVHIPALALAALAPLAAAAPAADNDTAVAAPASRFFNVLLYKDLSCEKVADVPVIQIDTDTVCIGIERGFGPVNSFQFVLDGGRPLKKFAVQAYNGNNCQNGKLIATASGLVESQGTCFSNNEGLHGKKVPPFKSFNAGPSGN